MKTILCFEPRRGGHRAEYFAHLAARVIRTRPEARLVFVTPRGFAADASEAAGWGDASGGRIELCEISAEEESWIVPPRLGRVERAFRLKHVLDRQVARIRPDHAVILDLTPLETALCFSRMTCPWSAIMMVQYPEQPPMPGRSLAAARRRAKFRWKEWKTARLLADPGLKTLHLFHGDEAVRYLNTRFPRRPVFESLPDPLLVGPAEEGWNLRETYGIPADRRLFLLAGALSDRKGARLFLEALARLPAAAADRAAFLVCGVCEPGYEAAFVRKWEELRRRRPELVLVSEPGPLPLPRWKAGFAQSDVVVLPYQRPEYSSGVLGHAVEAGKPVLGPAAGVIGRLIRTHRLGEAIPMQADTLSAGIDRWTRAVPHADPDGQQDYLALCSADVFATRLLAAAGVAHA